MDDPYADHMRSLDDLYFVLMNGDTSDGPKWDRLVAASIVDQAIKKGEQSGSAVPSVVPPPEWGEMELWVDSNGEWRRVRARCGCIVRVDPRPWVWRVVLPAAWHCPDHPFADCDSGLALLRGALAQQERTEP